MDLENVDLAEPFQRERDDSRARQVSEIRSKFTALVPDATNALTRKPDLSQCRVLLGKLDFLESNLEEFVSIRINLRIFECRKKI